MNEVAVKEYQSVLTGVITKEPSVASVARPAEGRVNTGDCIKIMQALPSGSVQCVFADPPFNLGKKYNSYNDKLSLQEYLDWTEQWIEEAVRVLSDSGTLFIYNIPRLLVSVGRLADRYAHFRHWIAWNAPGKPLGKSLQPSHYGILYYTKSERDYKFYDVRAQHKRCRDKKCGKYLTDYGGKEHLRHPVGPLVGDVWDDIHRVRHARKRIDGHPCQLPPHLVERLWLMATDPDDLVLDLFAGGGSAGVAAKQLGRRYIGCEIDSKYTALANADIDNARPSKVGDVYVSSHLGQTVSVRNMDVKQLSNG